MNCINKKNCHLNIGCCPKTKIRDYKVYFCNNKKLDNINKKIYNRNIPDNLCTVIDYRPSFKVCNKYTHVVKPVTICKKKVQKTNKKLKKFHPSKGDLASKSIDIENYLFFNNDPVPKLAQVKNNINKFCNSNILKIYNDNSSSYIENDIKCKLFFNNMTKRSLNNYTF